MASSNFINECKTPAYEDRLGKIVIDGVEYNQSDNLTSLELDDGIYNNGTIIGSTYTKGLKFSLINVDKDTEFVGKKAIPSVGVKYDNDTTEYIDFDEFTIEALNDEQTKNFTDITGYDSLNILDTKYESDLDEGSHTIGEYWLDLVEKLGLETETPTFTNSTIIIPSNPFVNNESYRTVLSEIEKVSCSFCKVEKRTRTVNNQEEVYHVINLKWFDDYYDEETITINESAMINDVYKSESVELLGNTSQVTSILPNGYTQVDYIQSSGAQYIDTGHILNENDVIDITYDYVSAGFVFGSRTSNTSNYTGIVNEDTGQYNIRMGNTIIYHNNTAPQGTIKVHIESGNTKINNEIVSTTNYGTNFFNGNCYLFTMNNNGRAFVGNFARNRIRYFKIDGVIELVPCYRNSDNEVGMYDLINNVFYANAGTGTFTKGSNTDIPSPDYPQDIHVVSGDNYINVCGKNLFNGIWIAGTVNLNTGEFTSVARNRTDFIQVKQSTPYTIWTGGGVTTYFIEYGKTHDFIKTNTIRAVETQKTFTTNENTKYAVLYQYVSYTPTNKVQLEFGNQVTEYEAYKGANYPISLGDIELCKIGTYQDSIVKDNGKWYLNKKIGKVVFDGSNDERWNLNSAGTYTKYQWSNALPDKYNVINTPIYCSHFKQITVSQGDTKNIIGIANGVYPNYSIQFVCDISTLADFKAWLGTNKPIVYYPLATPTVTEITDTELIEELDSIKLQKGLNNIGLVGDITPELKIDYRSDVPNYEFETSDYSTLEGSLTKYGPVNCVLLGNENISGENVYLQDDESITQNGETKVLIDAEYFLYTQALREQAIQGVYDKLNNFEYYDLSLTTYYGKPFLEVGNKIRVNTNEGNVYDTFILQHTFTYDGTFKSVIKSPALTKQENIVKSTESISSRVNRTEIMVDKANGEITSITSRTKYLEDNTYTIEQTNQLIQTAENGLINTFSEAGGNNILRNTGLWFSATTSEQTIFPSNDLFPSGELFTGNKVVYEFWEGNVSKKENDKAVNMVSLNLLAGYLSQEQKIPNGYYVVSFKYKKTNALANSKVKINDIEYPLTSAEDTDFTQIIEVSSQHINIQFYTDIDESCEIYDLMVNAGQTKLAYSQNQNETTTDTVKIGQGITITSSNTDTTFKANADGIRTIDKSGNELTKFTDVGMTTKRMIVDDDSQIVGTLWQEVGGQTWITRL